MRARIDQLRDALARRQLAVAMLLLDFPGAAALAQPRLDMLEPFEQTAHVGDVLRALNTAGRAVVHSRFQDTPDGPYPRDARIVPSQTAAKPNTTLPATFASASHAPPSRMSE